jgi:hypothetical protein
VFAWVFLNPLRGLWAGDSRPYAPVVLLTLLGVLVEGGCWWLAKRWLLGRRRAGRGRPRAGQRGLQLLYAANVVLVLAFPAGRPVQEAIATAVRWSKARPWGWHGCPGSRGQSIQCREAVARYRR